MATSIIIDAGHGGYDNGATYKGRAEKDDNLRLAMRVGEILRNQGYDVKYTRTEDNYISPFERAQIANRNNGDYFISFHRNSSPIPNTYQGAQSLVFSEDGDESNTIAKNINENLEGLGFRNIGVDARPNLVVLRRTNMPAVLIETGFINSDRDNEIFDERFPEIAQAIATGIEEGISYREDMPGGNNWPIRPGDLIKPTPPLPGEQIQPSLPNPGDLIKPTPPNPGSQTRPMPGRPRERYAVQIGLFRYESNADYQAELARDAGFDAEISYSAPYYAVRVVDGESLESASRLEAALKRAGFDTLIVTLPR